MMTICNSLVRRLILIFFAFAAIQCSDSGSGQDGADFISNLNGRDDDIEGKNEVIPTGPTIQIGSIQGYLSISLKFSAPLDKASAESASNYDILPDQPKGIFVVLATLDDSDPSSVHLSLNKPMLPLEYTVSVNNVKDKDQNVISTNNAAKVVGEGKVAFVTKALGKADLSIWSDAGGLTGVSAGDRICQAEADRAGLKGGFVAFLSDPPFSAIDQTLLDSGPWIRADGHPFAANASDLFGTGLDRFKANTNILVPLNLDPEGQPIPSGDTAFTGTAWDGTIYPNYDNCDGWTKESGFTVLGGTFQTNLSWLDRIAFDTLCSLPSHLYCFQTGKGPDLPTSFQAAQSDRRAFISSAEVAGNLGASPEAQGKVGKDAADAICQSLAAKAGLSRSDKYKAWISTRTESAKDRFINKTSPWYRTDGVKIADNLADLIDGSIFTTINRMENGKVKPPFRSPWTGTNDLGNVSGVATPIDTCDDWKSSNNFFGVEGQADSIRNWSGNGSGSCGSQHPLYCFED